MRVVKPPRDATTFEIECCHCGATVECARHELAVTQHWRDGDAYVLTCPCCKGETWVAASLFAEAT